MKTAMILAAALAAVTVACLWLMPGSAPRQPAASPPVADAPAPRAAEPWLAGDSQASVDAADDGSDDNTEVVLGIRVRKDRNCTVELNDYVTPTGEMFSAYSCTPHSPPPVHPYAHYDDATLEAMAWSDAEAAAVLGERLVGRDKSRSYELLVRATALDGDVTHLHWLADQAFSAVKINEEVQVDNLKRRYELAALAARLGGDPVMSEYWKHELVNAGVDTTELDRLDGRVDGLLEEVRSIQIDVFGEVRYGGRNDA